MKFKYLKIPIFLFVSIVLIVLDQITKIKAKEYLYDKEPIVLIKNVFELLYTENRGAAFGILQGQRVFFIIITFIVIFFMFYILLKLRLNKHYLPLLISLILIFSGAIGNFIDRYKNSYVVDFFYFKLIDFPVFNVADCYITIGCIILIISFLTIYKNEKI